MKQFAVAFLTFLIALTTMAHARPWQSALGETFDVYMVQGIETEDDAFAIMGLFLDTEGRGLDEVVGLADTFFEEALIHFAAGNSFNSAVVRFSPPGEVPEGELPPVTVDVRYETYDGQDWERVNYTDVPVSESRIFPPGPTTEVILSSGEDLRMEPASVLYPGMSGRTELNVRAVYPFFAMDDANGQRVMELLWDEVVRPMARREGVNNVSVAIYSSAPESRFTYREAYAEYFRKESWEGWPTYARMDAGDGG